MRSWTVDTSNRTVDAKLRKFRSDKRVINGYSKALRALAESDDPASVGRRKSGRLRNCYSCTLTKSHRMLYMIDYEARAIRVLDLGDHKEVYGRDSAS